MSFKLFFFTTRYSGNWVHFVFSSYNLPSCVKPHIYSTPGRVNMIDFSQMQLRQVWVSRWQTSLIIRLNHFTSIIHIRVAELIKRCGSDSEVWNQACDEQPLEESQPDWPVAWGHVGSGRKWRGFPWATTPGRAGHPSPWHCRWRRWSWPACHRTTPACGAQPGGCHSLT